MVARRPHHRIQKPRYARPRARQWHRAVGRRVDRACRGQGGVWGAGPLPAAAPVAGALARATACTAAAGVMLLTCIDSVDASNDQDMSPHESSMLVGVGAQRRFAAAACRVRRSGTVWKLCCCTARPCSACAAGGGATAGLAGGGVAVVAIRRHDAAQRVSAAVGRRDAGHVPATAARTIVLCDDAYSCNSNELYK